MSFDDLFALLLFIVFIGLPLLNRMQQRGRGGAPPGAPQSGRPRPSAPPQSRAPQAGPAGDAAAAGEREARTREERARQERAAPAAQSTTDTGRQRREGDPFAELAERLEEARRRVREASGAGTSASQASSQRADQRTSQAAPQSAVPAPRRTIATPAPPSQPIPDARANQPQRPRTARDPFPKARERPSAPWNQSTAQRRTALSDDAPALEVERPARTRLSSGSERRAREVARLRAKDLVALDSSSFRKGMLWHLVLSDPVGYRNRRKPSPPASR